MRFVRRQGWIVGFAAGAIVTLLWTGLWPNTPVHAVATDHLENFVMATGYMEEGVEGVFLLDSLTGSLRGGVLSRKSRSFQSMYEVNVLADLAQNVAAVNLKVKQENVGRKKQGLPARPDVQLPQTPRFLMVTGTSNLLRGAARLRPGLCVVYVAETTTGIVMAYALSWSPEMHVQDAPFQGRMMLWAADQFATTMVRTE